MPFPYLSRVSCGHLTEWQHSIHDWLEIASLQQRSNPIVWPRSTLETVILGHRRSLIEGRQLRAVIGNEDSEQACRLRCARILADEMLTAGWLEEALAAL